MRRSRGIPCSFSVRFLAAGALLSFLCPNLAESRTLRAVVEHDRSSFSVRETAAGTFYTLGRCPNWNMPGAPAVPYDPVQFALKDGEIVLSVTVTALETVDLGRLPKPSFGFSRPGADMSDWNGRTPFPDAAGEPGGLGIQRGTALQSVILWPVSWDPLSGSVTLRTRIAVEIETGPGAPLAGIVRPRRTDAASESRFLDMQRSLVLNPEDLPEPRPVPRLRSLDSGATPWSPRFRPSVDGSPVDMVIITSDLMAPEFQKLADWKTQRGILTVVRTISWIHDNYPNGVDQQETIRRFIADAVTNWGTEWVLLGGDSDVIPVRYARTLYFGGESIPADMYYQCLDGNWNGDGDATFGEAYVNANSTGDSCDLWPEVWLGRAAVSDSLGAATFVSKSILYEKTPTPGYLNRAMIMAEVLFPQNFTPGDSIIFDGATIAEQAWNYFPAGMTKTRLYENAPPFAGLGAIVEDKPTVIAHVNAGYGIVQHIGHGYVNSMAVGAGGLTLDNSDAGAFTNGTKTCVLYSINCTSAAIDFNCIGEEWLRNPQGGAVANVGSTRFDFPGTGIGYQNEFYYSLFQTNRPTLGEAFALSKTPFAGLSTRDSEHRWTQFSQILLGDPSLQVWTGEPVALSVSHPPLLTLGVDSVVVTVTRLGSPVDSARVCLVKTDDDYETMLTNAQGQAVVPFRPDRPGIAVLTVTAPSSVPYQDSLGVVAPPAPHLFASGTVVDDTNPPSIGNADSILDLDETAILLPTLRNEGTASATGITAVLSSPDPNITVLDANASYPNLAPGQSAAPTDGFLVFVSGPLVDRYETTLSLTINAAGYSRTEPFVVMVGAPLMERYQLIVSDVGVGNGNGIIEAGENQNLTLKVRNNGRGAVLNLVGKLRSLGAHTVIVDSVATYGNVQSDSVATPDPFVFRFTDSDPTHPMRFILQRQGQDVMSFDINVVKPDVPGQPAGGGKASSIALTWTPVGSADLLGYVVYRSLSPGGPFQRINAFADSRMAYYNDEFLPPLTRFYYRVASIDSSGNESAQSSTAGATTTLPLSSGFPIPLSGATSSSPTFSFFNGDTIPEIVCGSNELVVVSGNGEELIDGDGDSRTHGVFSQSGFSNFWSPPSSADIDRDGVIDVCSAGWSNGMLYVFDGQSTPKPGFPVNVNVGGSSQPRTWSAPALVDVDGDSLMEIFINSGAHTYAYRLDGTEFVDGDNNPATTGVFAVLNAGNNYATPVITDLDNNGIPEVIIASRDTKLYVKRLDGTNYPGFPVTYSGDMTATPAIGDLDKDGLPEIVFGTSDNKLHAININKVSPPGWPKGVNLNQDLDSSPALGDLDGDGFLDVAICAGNGTVYVFKGQNGAILPGWPVIIYDSSGLKISIRSSPALANVDADPDIEVVFGGQDGNVYAYKINGQPALGFPIKTDNVVEGGPLVWDLDADGLTEVCVQGFDQKLYMWDTPAQFTPESCPWPMFAHDSRRTSVYGSPVFIVTGVPEAERRPGPTAFLAQNQPNPFSPRTTIRYSLPASDVNRPVELSVFDIGGRLVRQLVAADQPPGEYSVVWDGVDGRGSRVGAGVYFYRLVVDGEAQTRKLVMAR